MAKKNDSNVGFLERQFKLKENNTDVKTEILAGITVFMTMAYILVVNPNILSESGMDWGGVFSATAISAAIATFMMAFLANYPFALAPGMGLNAFFTYTVVFSMGKSWQFALTAVFIEGVIFVVLSLFKVREAIFESIPMNLKKSVTVGIGLFIALIGLTNAEIIQSGKMFMQDGVNVLNEGGLIIQLGNLKSPTPLLALIGLLITGALLARNVKGALFFGIMVTTIIGIPMGVSHIPESGVFFSMPPSLEPVFMKLEWNNIFTWEMLIVVFTFLFVDVFDTVGTLIGVSAKANMLDEDGNLPRAKEALLADAIGTMAGACLGTSTVTTFVESATGVAEGGRTGLTAFTTATLFLLALVFAPLFGMVPGAATAPALILVGLFMMSAVKDIDFDDFTEGIPAFLTIIMMPFANSIAEGIVFGMVSYVLLKVLTGKHKEVSSVMYVLAALFILKSIFI